MKTLAPSALALLLLPGLVSAASFTPLGYLDGGGSYDAYGVSADGGVVVGSAYGALGREAFRWTAGDGMVGLGDLAGRMYESEARGVSADGSVVVGSKYDAGNEAFRWTSDGGMVGLGASGSSSHAYGVSADGSVVVGKVQYASGAEAFRWTAGGGMVGLGSLANSGSATYASGVSVDGSVVVGYSSHFSGDEAYRWTAEDGMVGLGDLTAGSFHSKARGVSADGKVVVGEGRGASGTEAFRWTADGGMVGLGRLDGDLSSAIAASADGSVVVGFDKRAHGVASAFLWTEATGMQYLLDVLVANGATGLAGWQLWGANAISADGQWVVGYGYHDLRGREAFLANIGAVPAPATVWLLGTALAALGGGGWLRRKAAS